MYNKKKLRIVVQCDDCDIDECYNNDHLSFRLGVGTIFLEHSCDEWVIGGKEEVVALIADLQELLEL